MTDYIFLSFSGSGALLCQYFLKPPDQRVEEDHDVRSVSFRVTCLKSESFINAIIFLQILKQNHNLEAVYSLEPDISFYISIQFENHIKKFPSI